MKKRRSALIQLAILTALGAAVALTLLLPQMSGLHRRPQPLELSVIIREQDSSFWTNTRMGMEPAAGERGAELPFLTLATANDGREQWELLQREIEQGADALVVSLLSRDSLGWVGSEILSCEQGYVHSETASSAMRFVPVWRIETDAGTFHVSGITREVRQLVS